MMHVLVMAAFLLLAYAAYSYVSRPPAQMRTKRNEKCIRESLERQNFQQETHVMQSEGHPMFQRGSIKKAGPPFSGPLFLSQPIQQEERKQLRPETPREDKATASVSTSFVPPIPLLLAGSRVGPLRAAPIAAAAEVDSRPVPVVGIGSPLALYLPEQQADRSLRVTSAAHHEGSGRRYATETIPTLTVSRSSQEASLGSGRNPLSVPTPVSITAFSNRKDCRGQTPPFSSSSSSSQSGSQGDYPTPLRNLGNTCYMNAPLQCLLRKGSRFPGLLAAQGQNCLLRPSTRNGSILSCMVALQSQMLAGSCSPASVAANLDKLKNLVAGENPLFWDSSQNDAHEFVHALLPGLHQEVNRSSGGPSASPTGRGAWDRKQSLELESLLTKQWIAYRRSADDSVVYDHFGGMWKRAVTCRRCRGRSISCDPFLDISVACGSSPPGFVDAPTTADDAVEAADLRQLILSVAVPEELVSTSLFSTCCDGGKTQEEPRLRESLLELFVEQWPRELVIHMKRFSKSNAKTTRPVRIPLELPLGELQDISSGQPQPLYLLQGVVCHRGTGRHGGHFVAYVRRSHNFDSAQWFLCNDSEIELSSVTAMLAEALSGSYLLFYEAS
jgi:ubiquitin C-terminal hydrolase